MVLILDHFGGHILERAAKSVPLLHVVRLDAPSKIAYLDDVTILYEDILWFDISMNETLLVHVVNARTNLNEKVKCRIFTQKLFFSY